MSLENWLQSGYLLEHTATVAEVQKRFALVTRELSDAGVTGLSPDGQFAHAYDAAYQLCTIALHASGFEVAKGKGHHAYTINSLPLSMGVNQKETMIYLSKCSHLRSQSIYDHVGVVSAVDAQELMEAAEALRISVIDWLRAMHSNLLPKGL